MEHIVFGIVSVLVLGISAQWLAWRFRVPSILLLLIFGFLAGPVTGLLPPSSLTGDWVFAFVSLSIGIILFEGGLSLHLSELREVGKAVFNLITVGVLVTWALAGLAAYYIAGFNVGLSIQIGAILTVTGPTVVIPLLRHVRPTGRVGAVAKWEGITIDPVGAILAVLVLETIILVSQTAVENTAGGFGEIAVHALQGLLLTIFISMGISIFGAAVLIVLLRRRLIPDYLQNGVALMVVVGTFALSNALQEESGLLEVTLMGIIVANQKYVSVRRLSEFKEDLQVLLIACLFILLSARLELSALDYIDGPALFFLALLILFIRPIAVFLSSIGTDLTWKEQAFLSWLAPRGIVAAAVASLFAFRLVNVYPEQADRLVPVVFLVIVGTVAVYGLTISPLARWLGLAHPNPQGVLFVGAQPWAQHLARAVQGLGFDVLLIDANAGNIERAQNKGLPAEVANALSETVVDDLELGSIGRLLALTPNDEVNSLAALHFAEVFGSSEVYQMPTQAGGPREQEGELPLHLRGRPLFGGAATHAFLTDRFKAGGEVRTLELVGTDTYAALQERYGEDLVLLFIARGQELLVHAEEGHLTPQPGDTVVVFLPPFSKEQEVDETPYEELVAQAFVIDLEEVSSFEEVVQQAAALFALRLPITAERIAEGFMEGAQHGAMLIATGVALPHYRLASIEQSEMAMVRCRSGLCITFGEEEEEEAGEPVYALFFLVSPEDNPSRHLKTLAHLASRIGSDHFVRAWRSADDEQQLKALLWHPDRFMTIDLQADDKTAAWIGQPALELDLPSDNVVALVRHRGNVLPPGERTVLQEGDRLSITGDSAGIHELRSLLQ